MQAKTEVDVRETNKRAILKHQAAGKIPIVLTFLDVVGEKDPFVVSNRVLQDGCIHCTLHKSLHRSVPGPSCRECAVCFPVGERPTVGLISRHGGLDFQPATARKCGPHASCGGIASIHYHAKVTPLPRILTVEASTQTAGIFQGRPHAELVRPQSANPDSREADHRRGRKRAWGPTLTEEAFLSLSVSLGRLQSKAETPILVNEHLEEVPTVLDPKVVAEVRGAAGDGSSEQARETIVIDDTPEGGQGEYHGELPGEGGDLQLS